MLAIPDFGKWGRSEQLHYAFRAVWEYQTHHDGYLPNLNSKSDADIVVEIANELNAIA